MVKRVFLVFLAVLLCFFSLFGCSTANKNKETNTESRETETITAPPPLPTSTEETPGDEKPVEKTIDLYFIAGQSNATGNTKINDLQALLQFAPEAETGFSHVYYAGNSRAGGAGNLNRDRIIEWQKVTIGLGSRSDYIGPEVGIAKALSIYYNDESGLDAGIIKYAYNGSSLLNSTTGETHKDGNWVSPSYQKTLSPNDVVQNVTGQMYRNFLKQVETNIAQLKEYGGYTKVRVCGLYWMQGCANRYYPAEYETAFQYFAKDIRADLAEIMMNYTGDDDDDCGASNMPIVVGTISQTFCLTSGSVEAVNVAFINMQKGLADKIDNCYVVDNSAYRITGWESNKQVIYGSDQYHWNQTDMLEIGRNVGNLMLRIS